MQEEAEQEAMTLPDQRKEEDLVINALAIILKNILDSPTIVDL